VGEHLLCKQGVVGSIPSASTSAVRGGGAAGWAAFGSVRKAFGHDCLGRAGPWVARGLFDIVKRVLALRSIEAVKRGRCRRAAGFEAKRRSV
jgi:hypothetical protein